MTLPQAYRGERIGLPQDGSGSLAPTGLRLAAYLVDAVASALAAGLFVRPSGSGLAGHLPGSWSLIPLAVDYVGGLLLAGRTLGMYLFGLRVVRVDDPSQPVTPGRALGRTLGLFLFVPALVFDRDGRGMHDRFTDTAVVRS